MSDEAAPELLAARALAFPLLDEAFETRAVEIPRTVEVRHARKPGEPPSLAEAFERWARTRAGGASLELLRQAWRCHWLRDARAGEPFTLRAYLQGLARRLLARSGAEVLLEGAAGHDGNTPRERDLAQQAARWRWITFHVPADLFVAALHAGDDDPEPRTHHVTLVTPQLRELLQDDVAQLHLHVSAGFGFPELWAGLMGLLAQDKAGSDWPRALGEHLEDGEARRLAERTLAAALMRVLLARYLVLTPRARSFQEFLGFAPDAGQPEQPHAERLATALEALHWPGGVAPAHALTLSLMGVLAGSRDLGADDTAHTCVLAQRLYRRLVFTPDAAARAGAHGDPLADVFPTAPGVRPETPFTVAALRYLREREARGARDHDFEILFWQYQRARDALYRYVVQEPGTAGLDWFTIYAARISSVAGGLKKRRNALALELESRELRLRSLELRTSPDATWDRVRERIVALARAAREQAERPEIGLVLHLIKEHVAQATRRPHADPRSFSSGARYGAWFRERQSECLAIESAIEKRPELLLVLRGLDAANVELPIPLWVLVPLLRRARAASERAAHALEREHPAWRVPPLRQTLHAGEDFRHLAEGLRRMHEPLEFGLLRVGDRLGHGFALGVDPERWCRAHPVVHQPREERLEDLLWELERYGRGELCADAARLERVRREAREHARRIYGPDVDLEELLELRRARFDEAALAALRYPDANAAPIPGDDRLRLLQRYLRDSDVYERGAEALEVVVDATDRAMLRAAQAFLRRRLGCHEITLEVNPSSNLLIGDLADLESHPLFRLQPLPGRPEPEGGAVLATINDDDPLVFATRLADEYAYLYFGLLRHGVPAQEALEYLARLRRNAWRARFTLPASADARALEALAPPRRA